MDNVSPEILETLHALLKVEDPTFDDKIKALTESFETFTNTLKNATVQDLFFDEDNKREINNTQDSVKRDLKKKAENLKKLTVEDITGLSPSKRTKNTLKQTHKDIEYNIDYLGKRSRKLRDFQFDIPSILGAPPKAGPLMWLRFKSVQGDMLNKLSDIVQNIDPKEKGLLKRPNLASIFFGEKPQMGFRARRKFAAIRWGLLTKLSNFVNDFDIKNIISDRKDMSIGKIFFNEVPEMSKKKFNKIRNKTLNKIKGVIESEAFQFDIDKDINIVELLFNQTPRIGLLARMKFNATRENILSAIEDRFKNALESLSDEEILERGPHLMTGMSSPKDVCSSRKHTEETELIEKKEKVVVADFGDGAVNKLNKWFEGIEVKPDPSDEKEKAGIFGKWLPMLIFGKWLPMLKKLLMPVVGIGLLAGGILGAFSGLTDAGPLMGLKKVGSKILTMLGARLVLRAMGRKAIKAIPGIGAVFGLGFAISRIIQGDYEGGLWELGGAFANLIPVVGPAISLGIDAYLAIRDIRHGGPEELAKTSKFNQWWTDTFVPSLENIPFIRGIVEISGGLGMMFGGDIAGGFRKVGRGLFSFTGVGIAFDAISQLFEVTGVKDRVMPHVENFTTMVRNIGRTLMRSIFERLGLERFFEVDEDNNITFRSAREIFHDLTGDRFRSGKSKDARHAADIQEVQYRARLGRDLTMEERNVLLRRQQQMQTAGTGRQILTPEDEQILKKLREERLKLREERLDKLNDFIWRPGQDPVKISEQDTLVGAKDSISLREGKDIYMGIKDLGQDLTTVKNTLHNDLQELKKIIQESAKETQAAGDTGSPPGLPGDFGRPVHEYRTRVRGVI